MEYPSWVSNRWIAEVHVYINKDGRDTKNGCDSLIWNFFKKKKIM